MKKIINFSCIAIITVAMLFNVGLTTSSDSNKLNVYLCSITKANASDGEEYSSEGLLGHDEVEDTRTFNDGDVIYDTNTQSNDGSYSYEFGAGASAPIPQAGLAELEANGQYASSSSTGTGSTTTTYHRVNGNNKQYHRWDCDDTLGSCINDGAGSEWRSINDNLPARAGMYDGYN